MMLYISINSVSLKVVVLFISSKLRNNYQGLVKWLCMMEVTLTVQGPCMLQPSARLESTVVYLGMR